MLTLPLQTLDGELDEKYKKVENLIAKKTEESADARRKAEMLQNEAKTLLAQANSKLQLLKGRSVHSFTKKKCIYFMYFKINACIVCFYLKGENPFTLSQAHNR